MHDGRQQGEGDGGGTYRGAGEGLGIRWRVAA